MKTTPSSKLATDTSAPAQPKPVRHNLLDNIQGQIFGVLMIAFGMSMLHSMGLIIGQAAGVAFLITYTTGFSFGTVFFLINTPFYLLAALRMGYAFTLNTVVAVSAVSVLTNVSGNYISYRHIDPVVGAVLAGLCVGIGVIGLYRHNSSCGGMSILAAYIQEKTGFKAGWFLMMFDALLFTVALMMLKPTTVLYSLIAAISMNLLVAWNHRKEWYVAK